MQFSIYLDSSNSPTTKSESDSDPQSDVTMKGEHVIECWQFNFSYPDSESVMVNGEDSSKENLKKQAILLIRSLIEFSKTLGFWWIYHDFSNYYLLIKTLLPHRWASWRSFFDHQVVLLWRCDSSKLWATLLHQGFHYQSQVRREIESLFVILFGIFIYFFDFIRFPREPLRVKVNWRLSCMILLIDSLLF